MNEPTQRSCTKKTTNDSTNGCKKNPAEIFKKLGKSWTCVVCGEFAEYNDCRDKLCRKHWCMRKGFPHGKSKRNK